MAAHAIIVSCARDLAVNQVSIPSVLQHIRASSFTIIVPREDETAFRNAMPSAVRIVPEESILGALSKSRMAEQLPATVAYRAGWYYQQLLKIEAVRQLAADQDALIWDGDTVPLRDLEYRDSVGRVGFYLGKEFHAPYFDMVRKLLNVDRMIPLSFVAQCMYLRVRWLHELIDAIERRANRSWIEAVMVNIPGISSSEFSEYETIGSFVAAMHPDEIFLSKRPWFRWGMAYFGGLNNVNPSGLNQLARSYDYVALESWDRGPAAWIRCRSQMLLDRARMLGAGVP